LSGYFLIKKDLRNLFLLAASLFFYFWGEGKNVLIIVAYMFFNYYFGLYIEKYKELSSAAGDRKAKAIFLLSLCFNIGVFVFYKYFNFIVENVNYLIALTGYTIHISRIHLPIGISFFAFQALSYVIDVYRRDVKAQRSLINFSMYKGLFPQLIAGPIVRYRDVAGQVENRTVTLDTFYSGVQRFIVGLGKKVIIANSVADVADMAFKMPRADLSFGAAWLGAVCYGLQIYFDFSGYSDMAIGLGKMFGFHFLENFNYPYISRSVRDFWRRWHISLSTWFRDYLYIPLGGNKMKPTRTYLNLITVFFLCGLWHGASWTFVIWGLWHGVFLVMERTRLKKFIEGMPKPMGYCYTSIVVLVGWVFFRSESLAVSVYYLKAMFGFGSAGGVTAADLLNTKAMMVIPVALVGSTPVVSKLRHVLVNFASGGKEQGGAVPAYAEVANILILFSILVICSILLSSDIYNPFIYFRF
jgi:alginate O-acetyltransferase complex protein AlgI